MFVIQVVVLCIVASALQASLILVLLLWRPLLEWGWSKAASPLIALCRWLPITNNFCPHCRKTTLKLAYSVRHSYPHPTPHFYLCQGCGARWKRLFGGPLEDASDAEYDFYFQPDLPYYYRGEAHNGNEPMEVTPFQVNWVKCPNCGWRFSLGKGSWSHRQTTHSRCGQRLVITPMPMQ